MWVDLYGCVYTNDIKTFKSQIQEYIQYKEV